MSMLVFLETFTSRAGWSRASLCFGSELEVVDLGSSLLIEQGEVRSVVVGDHESWAVHSIGLVHQQIASLSL